MPSPKPQWPKELIRRGQRVGSKRPDYIWWQEVPADISAESVRSVGYEVVSVIPTSEAEKLVEALGEAIDFAEEGWAYASDYFRDKWEFERERDKLRAALNHYRTLQGGEQGRG